MSVRSKSIEEEIKNRKWEEIYKDRYGQTFKSSSEREPDFLKFKESKSPELVYERVRERKELSILRKIPQNWWSYIGASEWKEDNRTSDKYRLKIFYLTKPEIPLSRRTKKKKIYMISKIYSNKEIRENLYYK